MKAYGHGDLTRIEAQLRERRGAAMVAETALDRARSDLAASVLEAHEAGLSLGWIATITGLSKARVQQIVEAGRELRADVLEVNRNV